MAQADAIRLLEVARRGRLAVERDRQLAEDDRAFRALVDAGADLLEALTAVVADEGFWGHLRGAAEGNALLPPNERDALTLLLESELPAVFEALKYEPPPNVEELLAETMLSVAQVLENQLPLAVRVERIEGLKFGLATFNIRLRQLVEAEMPAAPRLARARLRQAVYQGTGPAVTLGIAAAGIGAELGLGTAGAGAFAARLGGKAGEVVTQAMAALARKRLGIDREDAEVAAEGFEIDPRARIKAFSRLLESRLSRLATFDRVDEEALALAEADVARLARAVQRGGAQPLESVIAEVKGGLQEAHRLLAGGPIGAVREGVRGALGAAERVRKLAEHGDWEACLAPPGPTWDAEPNSSSGADAAEPQMEREDRQRAPNDSMASHTEKSPNEESRYVPHGVDSIFGSDLSDREREALVHSLVATLEHQVAEERNEEQRTREAEEAEAQAKQSRLKAAADERAKAEEAARKQTANQQYRQLGS
jgi:hypothetical protein